MTLGHCVILSLLILVIVAINILIVSLRNQHSKANKIFGVTAGTPAVTRFGNMMRAMKHLNSYEFWTANSDEIQNLSQRVAELNEKIHTEGLLPSAMKERD